MAATDWKPFSAFCASWRYSSHLSSFIKFINLTELKVTEKSVSWKLNVARFISRPLKSSTGSSTSCLPIGSISCHISMNFCLNTWCKIPKLPRFYTVHYVRSWQSTKVTRLQLVYALHWMHILLSSWEKDKTLDHNFRLKHWFEIHCAVTVFILNI